MHPAAARHDLIFAHDGEGRVAASTILGGMMAVLIGGALLPLGPLASSQHQLEVVRNAAPAQVRVIGAAVGNKGSCGKQVWPNIDQHCLVRTNADAKSASAPPAERADDKLSPLTAAALPHYNVSQDVTNGSAPPAATRAIRAMRHPMQRASSGSADMRGLPGAQARKPTRRHHGFRIGFHFGEFHF